MGSEMRERRMRVEEEGESIVSVTGSPILQSTVYGITLMSSHNENSIQYLMRPQDTTIHHTTQHNTALHYTTQHNTTLHYTTQHNTTQRYTTLHYTTLHHATLHYTTHLTSACYELKEQCAFFSIESS